MYIHIGCFRSQNSASDATVMEQSITSPVQHTQNDYSTSSIRSHLSEADTDSEPVAIRGVPQEPARAPRNPEVMFQRCGSGRRPSSRSTAGSRQRLNEFSRSQQSLSLPRARSREFSPRPGPGEVPIPRQRTPDSLSRSNLSDQEFMERQDSLRRHDAQPLHLQQQRSPRQQLPAEDYYNSVRRESDVNRSYDSHSFTKARQNGHPTQRSFSDNGYHTDHLSPRRHASPRHIEESMYRPPTHLQYSEHAGSRDSGVQHMSVNIQSLA